MSSLRPSSSSSHPAASRVFLNNLVLSNIATHLRPKDLLHLRLTTSAWNRAFIPTLRRRHRPIAVVKMPLHEYHPTSHMSDYTQVMRGSQCQQTPFGRYEISTFTSNGDHEFNEFFSVCGPTMTNLKFSCYFSLRDDETDNLERMRRMIFELAPNLEYLDLTISGPVTQPEPHSLMKMEREAGRIVGRVPKLKHLSFQTWNVGGPYLDQLHYLLQDLLLHATGLKNLHLLVSGFDFDGYHNLKALRALREYAPHLDEIKNLTGLNVTTPEVRVLLELAHRKEKPLRLEKLTASVMSTDGNLWNTLAEFRSFLVTQAHTLRHLDVTFGCGFGFGDLRDHLHRSAHIQLPSMRINTFKLDGMGHFDIQFEEESLGNAFPKLKRLDLLWGLIAGNPGHTRLPVCQLSHPEVTTLAITRLYPAASRWTQENDARLEELAQMLPGVTSFEMCIPYAPRPFDPFISRVIWVSWPALTELDIKYSVDTGTEDEASASAYLDEWLSGIPKSNFGVLEAELEYVLTKCTTDIGTLQTLRNLSGAFKSLPGISDLRHLRRFNLAIKPKFLETGKRSCSCNPSNLGGYLGLALASPTLQHLVIRCDKEFLSPECKSFVKFALGPQVVIELGGNGPSDEENLRSDFLSELHDDLTKTHFW